MSNITSRDTTLKTKLYIKILKYYNKQSDWSDIEYFVGDILEIFITAQDKFEEVEIMAVKHRDVNSSQRFPTYLPLKDFFILLENIEFKQIDNPDTVKIEAIKCILDGE